MPAASREEAGTGDAPGMASALTGGLLMEITATLSRISTETGPFSLAFGAIADDLL